MKSFQPTNVLPEPTISSANQSIINNLTFSCFKTPNTSTMRDWYEATSYAVREHVIEHWIQTSNRYHESKVKRVYYLSLEFLVGRMLTNAALNIDAIDSFSTALAHFGKKFEEVVQVEHDAALGNGGLGRLAACFMDSLSTLNIPSIGYGIRYEYGMFRQVIDNGQQVENPDNWLRNPNVWEFPRPEVTYDIRFYGKVETTQGKNREWTGGEHVVAMAYDMPVPGFNTTTVNTLRLWSAKAPNELDLDDFNRGNYENAVKSRNDCEVISKVLYPNDNSESGKVLRLKQQYFFVSASIQDILRRFIAEFAEDNQTDWNILPDKVSIQLNDTHPAIGVAEMMYQLMDRHHLEWRHAWSLVTRIFAYTNHTLMPEALETWSENMLHALLPRHLEIIHEINHYFLDEVRRLYPNQNDMVQRLSIIDDKNGRRVRMAHLAIVGSHTVNGVAALHSHLLKSTLFADFNHIFPNKIINITNGITPRRWLNQANSGLRQLLINTIGDGFMKDLSLLNRLIPFADNPDFRRLFMNVKQQNKQRLAQKIFQLTGITLSVDSLFDIQIKRIHEYKRQLLNLLHVVTLYNRIRLGQSRPSVPRVVIFGGKAAPGYWMAKQIIRLINDVANKVNNDVAVGNQLKIIFYPNYDVSAAELLFPAADLSEQISTAGTEASGTGNMKMALNGALTIGTLDGANIEIMEEVGAENMFIFGHTTTEIAEIKASGYKPSEYYLANDELRMVIDMIGSGYFCPSEPGRYQAIYDSVLSSTDPYLLLADYEDYVAKQDLASILYSDDDAWAKKAILNVAGMGKFSSDRSIAEYANNIWNIGVN